MFPEAVTDGEISYLSLKAVTERDISIVLPEAVTLALCCLKQ